jgi:hypothetical protein
VFDESHLKLKIPLKTLEYKLITKKLSTNSPAYPMPARGKPDVTNGLVKVCFYHENNKSHIRMNNKYITYNQTFILLGWYK